VVLGQSRASCTDACTSAALVCVDKFAKVDNEADFQAASDGSVSCGGYDSNDSSETPGKHSNGNCFWWSGSGGTPICAASYHAWTRLCSCQCAAGTYSDSNLKSYPCSTYVCIHLLVYLWLSTFVILTFHFLL
jgi:hypothetical protein